MLYYMILLIIRYVDNNICACKKLKSTMTRNNKNNIQMHRTQDNHNGWLLEGQHCLSDTCTLLHVQLKLKIIGPSSFVENTPTTDLGK